MERHRVEAIDRNTDRLSVGTLSRHDRHPGRECTQNLSEFERIEASHSRELTPTGGRIAFASLGYIYFTLPIIYYLLNQCTWHIDVVLVHVSVTLPWLYNSLQVACASTVWDTQRFHKSVGEMGITHPLILTGISGRVIVDCIAAAPVPRRANKRCAKCTGFTVRCSDVFKTQG
jgi:hypothetical protein